MCLSRELLSRRLKGSRSAAAARHCHVAVRRSQRHGGVWRSPFQFPAAMDAPQLLPLSLEGLWTASRRQKPDLAASLSRSVARLCFVTRGQLLEGLGSMELQLLHSGLYTRATAAAGGAGGRFTARNCTSSRPAGPLAGASTAPSILAGCLVRYKAEGRHHLDFVSGTAAAAATGQLLLRLAASGRTLPAASLSNSSPLDADAAWEQQGRAELEELAARLAPPTCRQASHSLHGVCCSSSLGPPPPAWCPWLPLARLLARMRSHQCACLSACLHHRWPPPAAGSARRGAGRRSRQRLRRRCSETLLEWQRCWSTRRPLSSC